MAHELFNFWLSLKANKAIWNSCRNVYEKYINQTIMFHISSLCFDFYDLFLLLFTQLSRTLSLSLQLIGYCYAGQSTDLGHQIP